MSAHEPVLPVGTPEDPTTEAPPVLGRGREPRGAGFPFDCTVEEFLERERRRVRWIDPAARAPDRNLQQPNPQSKYERKK